MNHVDKLVVADSISVNLAVASTLSDSMEAKGVYTLRILEARPECKSEYDESSFQRSCACHCK